MAVTFTSIATTTLSSASNTVNFNSIPQTYTDLRLVCTILGTGTFNSIARINSDTSTSYAMQVLFSSGSANSVNRNLTMTGWWLNYNYNPDTVNYLTATLDLNSYTNTQLNKTSLIQSFRYSVGQEASAGSWFNNVAVSSINLITSANQFAIGSIFTLYGILRA